eukprot:m.243290 g.243290  ORF g.243290 m.243290 type:complete len:78 (+) comp16097_c0_seq41:1-234(+)
MKINTITTPLNTKQQATATTTEACKHRRRRKTINKHPLTTIALVIVNTMKNVIQCCTHSAGMKHKQTQPIHTCPMCL